MMCSTSIFSQQKEADVLPNLSNVLPDHDAPTFSCSQRHCIFFLFLQSRDISFLEVSRTDTKQKTIFDGIIIYIFNKYIEYLLYAIHCGCGSKQSRPGPMPSSELRGKKTRNYLHLETVTPSSLCCRKEVHLPVSLKPPSKQ